MADALKPAPEAMEPPSYDVRSLSPIAQALVRDALRGLLPDEDESKEPAVNASRK